MRSSDTFTESLFTLEKLEDFVPANQNNWLSQEHFSVDGILIKAWSERETAKVMIGKAAQTRSTASIAPGADKSHDAAEFVKHLRKPFTPLTGVESATPSLPSRHSCRLAVIRHALNGAARKPLV